MDGSWNGLYAAIAQEDLRAQLHTARASGTGLILVIVDDLDHVAQIGAYRLKDIAMLLL